MQIHFSSFLSQPVVDQLIGSPDIVDPDIADIISDINLESRNVGFQLDPSNS